MKKLITLTILLISAICSQGQIAYTSDADVYLQRKPIDNYTHIVHNNGHKYLEFTGQCGVLSSSSWGLNLQCNPQTGVRLADDSSNLHIPHYYGAALENPCTGEDAITEEYKEDFQLTWDGNNFPYILNHGQVVNLVQTGQWGYDPAEWDSLLLYGHPDTMLAYSPDTFSNSFFDPYTSCRTGVIKGYSDTYNGNTFNIDSLPDGTYYLHVSINLPADVYDPGVYPNDYRRLCKITGDVFEWTDVLPPCCSYAAAPPAPTNVHVQGHTLSWSSVANATTYNVYSALAYRFQGGWTVGNHTPTLIASTTATSLLLPSTSGNFFYFVAAKNCAGESMLIQSRKVNQ